MVGSTPTGESDSRTKKDPANYDDPLYIHPSDNIVTTVVNFKITGTENFCVFFV